MANAVTDLAAIIAAHLREWDGLPAFVELAIFETGDPPLIAQAIDAFCVRQLGADVARALFYQSVSAASQVSSLPMGGEW
jgi:hypothetical protein